MLAAITAFLSAIPAIISVIKSIISFIQDEETIWAKKALADKLAAGLKKGVQTGDTSDVENILKSGNS